MKDKYILVLLLSGLILSCGKKRTPETTKVTMPIPALMIIPDSRDTVLSNGRRNIFLVGNRDEPGLFVERAIFPPGYRSNPHTHPGNMNITVIQGTLNLAYPRGSDTASDVHYYGPGSFVIIPADQPHFEWFTDTTLMDITGIGPLKTINLPIVHSSN